MLVLFGLVVGLAHVHLVLNQHPQVVFHQAAFQPLFPEPVVLHGVVVTKLQDLERGPIESRTDGPSPVIQPVQIPLQGLPALGQINTTTQLGVSCKLN